MAAMYAVYHGPHRLTAIARNIHKSAAYIASRKHILPYRMDLTDYRTQAEWNRTRAQDIL